MSAIINNNTDKIYACKYSVPTLVFMLNDTSVTMNSSNILSIEKTDDYDRNLRSVIKVSLRMDLRQKIWIMKNKRSIVCKFELDKIGQDRDASNFIVGPLKVWNTTFSLYLNDDDESTDIQSLEDAIATNEGSSFNVNDIENDSYYTSENLIDIYLFNADNYNASMKPFNAVFTEGNMMQMVSRLLTATNHKKVLMSPMENYDVYKELLVPANEAYKGLIYLDQHYGFYKHGSLIYYDVDKLYIINLNGRLTAKEEDEWGETVFLVTKRVNAQPGNGMIIKQKENINYISIMEDNVNAQKPSISKNDDVGSAVKVIQIDDIEMSFEEADQSYMNQRNESYTYIKKDDNKFSSSIIKARMEENEAIIYINAENLDISAFTPNKTYKIIFEETSKQERYGKYKYRLSFAYHMIAVQAENYMTSTHRIVLKRCSDD